MDHEQPAVRTFDRLGWPSDHGAGSNPSEAAGRPIRAHPESIMRDPIVVPLALLHTAMIDLAPAFAHLVDDLTQALGVYERITRNTSARAAGPDRSFTLATIDIDTGALTRGHDFPSAVANVIEQRRSSSNLPLYALAITGGSHAEPAARALDLLGRICIARNVPWAGGVAMGEGELIAPCSRSPRMGRIRRARSERIDLLIAAIRSSCRVHDLIGGPDTGILEVPRSIPPFLYPLAVAHFKEA